MSVVIEMPPTVWTVVRMTARDTGQRVSWRPIKSDAHQLAIRLADQTGEPHEVVGERALRGVDSSLRPVGT
jgi:hypothetical protein